MPFCTYNPTSGKKSHIPFMGDLAKTTAEEIEVYFIDSKLD